MTEREETYELAALGEAALEAPLSVVSLLRAAVAKGASVDALEKLVELYGRIEDRKAAQEFTRAMGEFHAACPPLRKARKASFATRSGGQFSYTYADLPEVCRTVNPLLHPLGLSYRWDSETSQDGARVKVTCILNHIAGHSVSASYEGPVDKGTGTSGAQDVQKVRTYGERQSLIQVLGISTADDDNDAGPSNPVSAEQLAELNRLMVAVGQDLPRFLKLLGVQALPELPASNFTIACNLLKAKQKASAN